MALAPGTRLGPYRVTALLGSGGMGEVYRATDTTLGREVAVKVLPAAVAMDVDRLARLDREARTLASLNHPNIAAIYGLERSTETTALVMELVEGETLGERIGRSALPLAEVFRIAHQLGAALEAAHDKGIVHRDLKPANVKITPDGSVKVLDFGLAKSEAFAGGAGDAATMTLAGTRESVIVGTAAYMSPEQARGQAVDRRTDIWAFGCVVFAMLSRRPAFARETMTDTLAAVLEKEPDWDEFPRSTPEGLRRLVVRCLEKNVKRRFRDIADVRFALEDAESATPSAIVSPAPARHWWLAAAAVALIAAVTAAAWWAGRKAATATARTADVILSPLTTDPGYEGEPTFAPDGETVAYVSDRSGNFDIYLRQASGGRDVNLTDDAADDVQPAFSPDGRQIAFVSSRRGATAVQFVGMNLPLLGGDIWVMPALGGNARRLVAGGNFPSWSPDGQSILYTKGSWFRTKIYVVAAAGGTPKEIPVALKPTTHWLYPSYSPDARWIVFEAAGDLYTVAAEGGEPHHVGRGHRPLWNADGAAIIYSSTEPGRNNSLWQVPISTASGTVAAPAQPLTVGKGRDLAGSVSRDGRRIAYTSEEQTFNLEVMPFDAEAGRELGRPAPLTFGNQLIFFFSFSPDGRSLVYDSRRGAESHIWRIDRGGAAQALTADVAFQDQTPQWSADGQGIYFSRRPYSAGESGFDLWYMASDGGNPRRVMSGAGPVLSDNRTVVALREGRLERADLTSGRSVPLTDEAGAMPVLAVSPDGKWIVYQSTASGNVDLRAVPVDGGASRVVVATSDDDYHPRFSPSGRWLYFQPAHKNLARVPGPAQGWKGMAPEVVTHFPESGLLIEDVKPSPDGRELAFARGRLTADVWILELRR